MKSKLICAMAVCWAVTALAVNEPAVIPQPQSLTRLEGAFKLAADTRIYTDPASLDSGNLLAAQLRQSTGWRFRISGKTTPDLAVTGGILLATSVADASLGAEGYELVVSTNLVAIHASTQAGLFYGAQ